MRCVTAAGEENFPTTTHVLTLTIHGVDEMVPQTQEQRQASCTYSYAFVVQGKWSTQCCVPTQSVLFSTL